ncbi:Uma2 family endonuclease [Microseira sp. BLCC-F43]|jgi:Uma2 family endonuclease|uniref:Uma2 family endonuclease n=1 Tax=Microseira sp. BLCC-F43 TaxID=3153602 RepID=UPI0035B89960
MSVVQNWETIDVPPQFPDHTQLPESDGTFVKNFQAHPQSILLTDSIDPVLQRLHPDGQYAIGQDCGIYWRETEPPEKGAEAPDWFYVPRVPARIDGQIRRSYVLWREFITPTIVLEFASGNGSEERDRTPLSRSGEGETIRPGKFWVYEQVMRIPYYGIYQNQTLEVYHLVDTTYQRMTPNERGHYPIPPMQVELGLWRGSYSSHVDELWLRWWDEDGNLLLTGQEAAEVERNRANVAEERANLAEEQAKQEQQKRSQLTERLKSLSPEQLQALGISLELLD